MCAWLFAMFVAASLAMLVAMSLALAAGPASAAHYTLDPAHSFVWFEIVHFKTSTIRGRFGPVEGSVTLDPQAGSGEVGLTIDTTRFDTGIAPFTARLREPDLLATAQFPQAWFVARRFRFEPRDGQPQLAEVRGEFTLRGVSRPLSLNAQRFGCRQDERLKREVCGGDFVAEFDRSEFGIDFGRPFIGNSVRLLVQVEGVRDD